MGTSGRRDLVILIVLESTIGCSCESAQIEGEGPFFWAGVGREMNQTPFEA